MQITWEFVGQVVILLIAMTTTYLLGLGPRKDKHKYDKSLTFNIDIDTLSDSFDLSQRMLAAVKVQLDNTQETLNEANESYMVLKIELQKAMSEINRYKEESKRYKEKVESLGAENKLLVKQLNICTDDCERKIIKNSVK